MRRTRQIALIVARATALLRGRPPWQRESAGGGRLRRTLGRAESWRVAAVPSYGLQTGETMSPAGDPCQHSAAMASARAVVVTLPNECTGSHADPCADSTIRYSLFPSWRLRATTPGAHWRGERPAYVRPCSRVSGDRADSRGSDGPPSRRSASSCARARSSGEHTRSARALGPRARAAARLVGLAIRAAVGSYDSRCEASLRAV